LPKKYKASTILAEIGDLITPKQKEFMKTKLITQTINFIDFTLFSINNPLK
jgi:transposase